MLHVVKMIRRRYPDKSESIIRILVALSFATLLIGVGLLLAQ